MTTNYLQLYRPAKTTNILIFLKLDKLASLYILNWHILQEKLWIEKTQDEVVSKTLEKLYLF